MPRRVGFLIIGQGLAGSLLAWTLLQRQRSVLVVDTGGENASQVAAGIINPITGLRLVKSPYLTCYLPSAIATYKALGQQLQRVFYHEKPMLRLLRTSTEALFAHKRLQDPEYHSYLDPLKLVTFNTPLGGVWQKQTGHLDTVALLTYLRAFFLERGCYQQSQVPYAALEIQPTIQWQGIQAEKVIFCEGYQGIHNPWFNWLPLQPVKGEILTLHSEQPLVPLDTMLNYGHWLLPQDPQHYRLGATFDRDHCDTQLTESAKTSLLTALQQLIPPASAVRVTQHQANMRPCSADRQPFIGQHPQFPQLCIFNGFGAKGSLQIPWCCEHFADALLDGAAINPVLDIRRHYMD